MKIIVSFFFSSILEALEVETQTTTNPAINVEKKELINYSHLVYVVVIKDCGISVASLLCLHCRPLQPCSPILVPTCMGDLG